MRISFPQYLFKSPQKSDIDLGKKVALSAKILFCGVARNVEQTLQKNIDRMKFIGSYFNEYKIFIYENDSVDKTKQILQKSNIAYESEHRKDASYWKDIESGKVNNHLYRCKSLAKCRNKYLNYANNYTKDYEYICIIDMDTRGWSYKGFFDSINKLNNIKNLACVSSYGLLSDFHNRSSLEKEANNLLMYDSFALRLEKQEIMSEIIQAQFNYIKFNEPTIVQSNFGGMAIYKMPIILDYCYDAELNNGFVDCDHVYLNKRMFNNNWKHMLNPYMVVSYSKHRFDND